MELAGSLYRDEEDVTGSGYSSSRRLRSVSVNDGMRVANHCLNWRLVDRPNGTNCVPSWEQNPVIIEMFLTRSSWQSVVI